MTEDNVIRRLGEIARLFPALPLVLAIWVLPAWAEGGNSVEQPGRAAVSRSSSIDLQFMGVVEPGNRLGIILMPGENLRELLVKEGDEVKKDDVVAKLSNGQLFSGFADLQQKKSSLQEGKQQIELLKLEIDLKEKHLARVNEEMAREKKLTETISGYSSSLSTQLETQQIQVEGQLTVLRARYDMALQKEKGSGELVKLIDDQIVEVRRRMEALAVRVPFDGKVKYVSPDLHRYMAGTVLCEIWDESHFKVRGAIVQHQFYLIKPGDRVRVSVDFVLDREVIGIVQSVGQSANQSIRQPREGRSMQGYASFEVMIKIEDSQGLIQPGMMVSVVKKESDNRTDK